MQRVGFEPTKPTYKILSLAPLTAREPLLYRNTDTIIHKNSLTLFYN